LRFEDEELIEDMQLTTDSARNPPYDILKAVSVDTMALHPTTT
jgi:hypothetical protein